MAESELTLEEREHLHKMSAIALVVVFSVIMLYFVYLMDTDSLKTLWDFIVRIGLPSAVGMPTAFFLTFEVLYHRRVKKRVQFHLRRFAGNMLVPVAGMLSLFLVQGIFFVLFSTALSERRAVLLGTGLWVLMFLLSSLSSENAIFRKYLSNLRKVMDSFLAAAALSSVLPCKSETGFGYVAEYYDFGCFYEHAAARRPHAKANFRPASLLQAGTTRMTVKRPMIQSSDKVNAYAFIEDYA